MTKLKNEEKMNRIRRLFSISIIVILLSACNGTALPEEDDGGGVGQATQGEVEKSTPVPFPGEADLVLTPEDNFGTFQLKRGQLLAIMLNMDVEFRLIYDPQYLTLVSPTENPETAGMGGWLFEAVEIGTTKIELVSIPGGESGGAPSFTYEVIIEISD
jgi:hypothetical protein